MSLKYPGNESVSLLTAYPYKVVTRLATSSASFSGGAELLQLIPPEATGKATEHFKHQVCSQQCSIPSGVILWRHLH